MLRREDVLRDEAGALELARLRREGRRRLLAVGGREGEWKRLKRNQGYAAVALDGTHLVEGQARSGWRTTGAVSVDDTLAVRDALAAAVLAAYVLILKQEEEAGAAGA